MQWSAGEGDQTKMILLWALLLSGFPRLLARELTPTSLFSQWAKCSCNWEVQRWIQSQAQSDLGTQHVIRTLSFFICLFSLFVFSWLYFTLYWTDFLTWEGRELSAAWFSFFYWSLQMRTEPWPTPWLQRCAGLGWTLDLQKLQDYKCVLFEAPNLVVICYAA